MKTIPGRAAFQRVCLLSLEELSKGAPSLQLKDDGVHINIPEDVLSLLYAKENRAVSELPPWQHNEKDPALKFPCTIKQFTDFMAWAGLSEFINDEELDTLREGDKKTAEASSGNKKKGGRPPGNLREAIERVYLKFYEEEDIILLKEHNIREFLREFKKIVDSEKGNFSEYVCERIASVKITRTGCKIIAQKKNLGNGKYQEFKPYNQNSVSKILSDLREKYPLSR